MPVEEALFYEKWQDAVRDLVRCAGGSKAVAGKLWPHKPVDEAQRLLADCLNDDRPARLDPDRLFMLMRLGREVGFHGLMRHIASDAGYTEPAPRDPRDEMADLQRQFITAVKQSQHIADRIERLTQPPLSVAK